MKNLLMLPLQEQAIKYCMRSARGIIILFFIVTLAAAICTVSGPMILSNALSKLSSASEMSLFGFFLLFAFTVACARVLYDVKMVLTNQIEQDVRHFTNKEMLNALLKAKGSLYATNNVSKISALIQNVNQSNKIYIQLYMMVMIGGIADIILSFFVVGSHVSWFVAFFVILYGFVIVFITLRGNNRTNRLQKQAQAKTNEGANFFGNVITNIVSIKIFRGYNWVSHIYGCYMDGVKSDWSQFYIIRLQYGALQAVFLFLQYASIFTIMLWQYRDNRSISDFAMISMVLFQLNRPFELIGNSIRDLIVARGMAQPMQAMIDEHSDNHRSKQSGLPVPVDIPLSITIRNLSFAYAQGERPVLSNIDANFRPGSVNYIVGPSGVGKSTLIHILLRLNDGYHGSVMIGGMELSDLDVDALLAESGYVPQESILMNLSIRENILLGRSFSDEEIMTVIRTVCLSEKLICLPEGLDFVIGERGQLLSGGEKQRLAIARALIARPRLLLLDEASSALDEHTERDIFKTLQSVARETTVIAITHRTNIIDEHDTVLNLSDFVLPRSSRQTCDEPYATAESALM